ncbi:hypothetical protein A9977_27700 [Variovorax sp. UMC13]|nr:hypothetical protein [Variovorax sp. UMC13]
MVGIVAPIGFCAGAEASMDDSSVGWAEGRYGRYVAMRGIEMWSGSRVLGLARAGGRSDANAAAPGTGVG